jgi:hypothetical protein
MIVDVAVVNVSREQAVIEGPRRGGAAAPAALADIVRHAIARRQPPAE